MNVHTSSADKLQQNTPKQRAIRYILISAGTLIFLFAIWYVMYWGNLDFGSQKLINTLPCGTGDYKLLQYESAKGNGHLDFVGPNGKVHASIATSSNAGVGQPVWDENCKGVLVRGRDEMERLEVTR